MTWEGVDGTAAINCSRGKVHGIGSLSHGQCGLCRVASLFWALGCFGCKTWTVYTDAQGHRDDSRGPKAEGALASRSWAQAPLSLLPPPEGAWGPGAPSL